MTLSALLVCVDEAADRVLRGVLEELRIRVESCPDAVRAAMRLAQERFDVIILDCDSQAGVTSLLRETRLSRMNDSTLAVAIVQGQEGIREMFSLGVNFVLYKPVSPERALSSLRAARAVMRKEKRRSARATVHAHATIDYANVEQEKATLVDLAADGMAVQFGKKLPPTSKVYFQFQLPGQKMAVRLSAQLAWQDWNGLAGVQFVDVPKASRRLLTEFLSANLPSDSGKKVFTDVTVELEEPRHSEATLVPSRDAHKGEPKVEQKDDHKSDLLASGHAMFEVATEAAETHAEDNRRGQTRYACRLGAEVYRTGTAVPNHCCLTDLSPGGCYLEVPLSFPTGISVEIIVRTYELKLQVRGTVQASHPGYGMGVAFELKTKEERDNVKKLTDYVATTAQAQ